MTSFVSINDVSKLRPAGTKKLREPSEGQKENRNRLDPARLLTSAPRGLRLSGAPAQPVRARRFRARFRRGAEPVPLLGHGDPVRRTETEPNSAFKADRKNRVRNSHHVFFYPECFSVARLLSYSGAEKAAS